MTITGVGENGVVSLRIYNQEINVWKEYSFNSNFLTPTDGWRFVVGDEMLTPALLDVLAPGARVTLHIDGAVQGSGYIDVVDPTGDRSSGNQITIEGRDTLSPVVDSQIDPTTKYPDKTPLDRLIEDTLRPFGFSRFEISNEANVNVAANRALPRRSTKHKKKLSQYKVPKRKPEHCETYWQFLCRITQRYGLWIWATVDGEGVVVGAPDYDQDPRYQIRRKLGGSTNNVIRGGVRRDATDQPSFIVASGNVPPREVTHSKMRVVVDNPYVAGLELGMSMQEQDAKLGRQSSASNLDESKTFVSFMERAHSELQKWTERVQVAPIHLDNPFASRVARPRYVKDTESKTIEELSKFAQRQMSLCTRKAVVGKYVIEGHRLDGQPIQVDTVVDVDDERSRWKGPMWILSRTFSKSRSGGTTTEIETIPLNALVF